MQSPSRKDEKGEGLALIRFIAGPRIEPINSVSVLLMELISLLLELWRARISALIPQKRISVPVIVATRS